jgi:aryl sulfotransferase
LNNILFVHFNCLRTDLAGEIKRIAQYLGISISTADLTHVHGAVSFDALCNNVAQTAPLSQDEALQRWVGGLRMFYQRDCPHWRAVLSKAELELYAVAKKGVVGDDCVAWLEQPVSC